MNKIKALFFLILLGATLPVFPEITIDGVLDEKEWQEAQQLNDFFITVPFSLEPAPLDTQVLIYSDEKGLYFAFINAQEYDTRDRRLHRRDDLMHTFDRNVVVVDFDNKANTGYMLGISLGDALIDFTITNENNLDGD